ncbi:hypothetical protein D3C77_517810 [compost metagenome]
MPGGAEVTADNAFENRCSWCIHGQIVACPGVDHQAIERAPTISDLPGCLLRLKLLTEVAVEYQQLLAVLQAQVLQGFTGPAAGGHPCTLLQPMLDQCQSQAATGTGNPNTFTASVVQGAIPQPAAWTNS